MLSNLDSATREHIDPISVLGLEGLPTRQRQVEDDVHVGLCFRLPAGRVPDLGLDRVPPRIHIRVGIVVARCFV